MLIMAILVSNFISDKISSCQLKHLQILHFRHDTVKHKLTHVCGYLTAFINRGTATLPSISSNHPSHRTLKQAPPPRSLKRRYPVIMQKLLYHP